MAKGILNFDPDEIDQDVVDFYGGDAQQIAQPDASYFSEFPLPSTRESVEASNPRPNAMPVMSQLYDPRGDLSNLMGGELGFQQPAFFNKSGIPAQIQQALAILAHDSMFSRVNDEPSEGVEEALEIVRQSNSPRQIMGGQLSEIEQRAMAIAAADPRAMLGGQPSQQEMAALSTPIDRTLQNRISELQTLNEGRMPNMGFMGTRF